MQGIAETGGGRRGNPWRMAVWSTAAFLLLLPLVAMQFTDEVTWDATDFIIIGVMLLAACGTWELVTRLSGNTAYRAGFGLAIVAAFLLVWINLAVGLIGSENNPANLMFVGVIAVGIIGAVIARFKPRGMARALMTTTLAQTLVGVIAMTLGSIEGLVLSGFFAALWLASAALFGKAAREHVAAGAAP